MELIYPPTLLSMGYLFDGTLPLIPGKKHIFYFEGVRVSVGGKEGTVYTPTGEICTVEGVCKVIPLPDLGVDLYYVGNPSLIYELEDALGYELEDSGEDFVVGSISLPDEEYEGLYITMIMGHRYAFNNITIYVENEQEPMLPVHTLEPLSMMMGWRAGSAVRQARK